MGLPVNGVIQPVTVVAGSVGTAPNRSDFATGQSSVTNPGVAVQLGNQAVPDGFSVFLTFRKANSGTNVYMSDSQANAQTHGQAKILNTQNAGIRLYVTNVNEIWIDADQANDGVDWVVEK
jgi:hypothetical protein